MPQLNGGGGKPSIERKKRFFSLYSSSSITFHRCCDMIAPLHCIALQCTLRLLLHSTFCHVTASFFQANLKPQTKRNLSLELKEICTSSSQDKSQTFGQQISQYSS